MQEILSTPIKVFTEEEMVCPICSMLETSSPEANMDSRMGFAGEENNVYELVNKSTNINST